jgi:hypothetical protein
LDFNDNYDVVGFGISISDGYKAFVYRNGAYYIMDVNDYAIFQAVSINNKVMVGGVGDSDAATDALIGYLVPVADLASAGRDGPVSIAPGGGLGLQGSMRALSFAGRPADWWLVAEGPAGVLSYDVPSRSWVRGFFPSAGLPMRDIGPVNLPAAGSAPGVYVYFLGVDLKRNGLLDLRYLTYDVLTVIQR